MRRDAVFLFIVYRLSLIVHRSLQELFDFVRKEIWDVQQNTHTVGKDQRRLMSQSSYEVVCEQSGTAELVKYDPSAPAYTVFQVDFELYRMLFVGLSPWGKAADSEEMAARIFRVSATTIERTELKSLAYVDLKF